MTIEWPRVEMERTTSGWWAWRVLELNTRTGQPQIVTQGTAAHAFGCWCDVNLVLERHNAAGSQ